MILPSDMRQECRGTPDHGGPFVPKPTTVAKRTARAAVPLTWDATSTDIRWGPSLTTAIVTHLGTHSSCTLGAALTSAWELACRVQLTSALQVNRRSELSVSTRQGLALTLSCGTRRARPGPWWSARTGQAASSLASLMGAALLE